MGRFLYFAYGSNLYLPRLRSRTPSCKPLGRAVLTHHTLRFHKRGLDGSGKADAFCTGCFYHRVWGVVYSIAVMERPRLDAAESLGVGYDRCKVSVTMGHRRFSVAAFRARPEAICSGLLPYDWYLAYLQKGALEQGFAEPYLRDISKIKTCQDPDRHRAIANRASLSMPKIRNRF